MDKKILKECISTCQTCAAQCTEAVASCLNREGVGDLTRFIRAAMECSSICRATAEMLSLESAFAPDLCKLCADVCKNCADEYQDLILPDKTFLLNCSEQCRLAARTCMIMFSEDSALPGIPQMTV